MPSVTPKIEPKRTAKFFSGRTLLWILVGIVAVRFISLGLYPLIDKSEARYAYIGELMLLTGNWVTPQIDFGVPFWAKPVLSTWLTAISLAAFGINAFAARFSSFLIFVGCGALVFALASRRQNRVFALVAACIVGSSGMVFYLGGTVMTDPALLLGVTLTMAGYWLCVAEPGNRARLWGYVFFVGVAIGLLSKGPIGAVIPGMSIVFWATHQHRWMDSWRRLPWAGGMLLVAVLVIPWYVTAEMHSPGFLRYFIIGEHFERFLVPNWNGDLYGSSRTLPFGTIWLFAFVGMLPWSGIAIGLLFRKDARRQFLSQSFFHDPWFSYLIYWAIAPLLLFTFARNILLTYAATALPALALLIAHAFWLSRRSSDRWTFTASAAAVPALLVVAVVIALIDPDFGPIPTQANVVATVKATPGGGSIVYVFDRPFSADFYSRGTAKYAQSNKAALELYNEGASYFAVPRNSYAMLAPDLRSRTRVVAQDNKTLLLKRQ